MSRATLPRFKVGEKVICRHNGRNMIGHVGMIMPDGMLVVDFVGESTRSLSYHPWQVGKWNRR